jgi:hypothetical protein
MPLNPSGRDVESCDSARRPYVVVCEDCSYEERAKGYDLAREVTDRHQLSTGHDCLAIEAPPNA